MIDTSLSHTRLMSSVFTRLHAGIPVAWEDVDTLRFGFDRAEARLQRPSPGVQRFLASLRAGVEETQVPLESRRAGVTAQQAAVVVAELEQVLHSARVPSPRFNSHERLQVTLCDDGREVAGLREALLATKLCVFEGGDSGSNGDATESRRLVILAERYLEPLERAQKWLLAELPQLPIRFSDRSISVGPLISPEGNPCHTCGILGLLEQDAALPVLASQLYGQTPASETEAGSHMAVAWAAVLLRKWIARDPTAHTTQIVIPITDGFVSGEVRIDRVWPHPECACSAFRQQSLPPQ